MQSFSSTLRSNHGLRYQYILSYFPESEENRDILTQLGQYLERPPGSTTEFVISQLKIWYGEEIEARKTILLRANKVILQSCCQMLAEGKTFEFSFNIDNIRYHWDAEIQRGTISQGNDLSQKKEESLLINTWLKEIVSHIS